MDVELVLLPPLLFGAITDVPCVVLVSLSVCSHAGSCLAKSDCNFLPVVPLCGRNAISFLRNEISEKSGGNTC